MHNNNLHTVQQYFSKQLQGTYSAQTITQFFIQLTTHITQLSKIQQLTEPNYRITESSINRYNAAIAQLLQHKPIQYIIGYEWFYGLQFTVNEHTLIPRPETEELVHYIINQYKNSTTPLHGIDIGTGSGCIGISLCANMSNANFTLCDISPQAIAVAQKNAVQNKCSPQYVTTDILNWQQHQWDAYDIVVSNPPYVMEQEKQTMQVNVLNYEPHTALFVPNADPLLFYKAIGTMAQATLKPQGLLCVEINEALGAETAQLFTQLNFTQVTIINDMHGKQRFVSAIK